MHSDLMDYILLKIARCTHLLLLEVDVAQTPHGASVSVIGQLPGPLVGLQLSSDITKVTQQAWCLLDREPLSDH